MKKVIYLSLLDVLFLPSMTLAQEGTIQNAVEVFGGIIALLIPIMIALGIVIFFYGLAMYLLKAGEEEGQRGARNLMIYGVVAVFVMVSIWGLVAMIRESFGVESDTDLPIPQVPGVTPL
ncbi:MAG TPA: hypothetical protein ENN31_01405 [Candidatus Vogelbacteria bacterium]|nr:hypothetical protein [Candidatus Vogelbacteria bacterium]